MTLKVQVMFRGMRARCPAAESMLQAFESLASEVKSRLHRQLTNKKTNSLSGADNGGQSTGSAVELSLNKELLDIIRLDCPAELWEDFFVTDTSNQY